MKVLPSLSILCASLSLPLTAQQPPATPRLQSRSASAVAQAHQLTLNVIVTDKAGNPISGLQPADFSLYDNRSLIQLTHVQTAPPIQISLVLDAINMSHEDLARAADQLRAFLVRNGGHLTRPISILLLSDSPPELQPGVASNPLAVTALGDRRAFVRRIPAAADGLALAKALDEQILGLRRISDAQAREGEAERVRLSLQALNFIATAELQDPARKLLLWISPGWALLAHSAAHTSDQLFDSIVYFSRLLSEARITLSAISPAGLSPTVQPPGLPPPQVMNGSTVRGGPTSTLAVGNGVAPYKSFYRPARSARDADPNDLALQVLAHQTGGLVPPPGNTIEPEIARCVAQAEALYVLSYNQPIAPSSTQFHNLEVKTPRAGIEIHAPTGYYTQPTRQSP